MASRGTTNFFVPTAASTTQVETSGFASATGFQDLRTRALTLAGGTITASAPALNITQTWNNAGVTFSAIQSNITNTNSAAGSLLMDLQVGGGTICNVGKAGSLAVGGTPSSAVVNNTQAGLTVVNTGTGGRVCIETYAASTPIPNNGSLSEFTGWHGRGTQSSKAAVQQGDVLAYFQGAGYDGSAFQADIGAMAIVANGTYSNGSQYPTYIAFTTSPIGSLGPLRRWAINSGGTLIGSAPMVMGWDSATWAINTNPAATPDTGISRNGAATFAFGNGTAADRSGTLQCATVSFTNQITSSSTSVSANTPILNLSQTWNNVGVAFTGVLLNITNTNSSVSSLLMDLQIASSSKFNITSAGRIGAYNNIATVAWGAPIIYGTGRQTGLNAAVGSLATYTVGPVDGTFEVSANINVTTPTSYNFTVTCSYTDEVSGTRVLTLDFVILNGTRVTTLQTSDSSSIYHGFVHKIRAKASTAITLATTGTFTTVTYNAEADIKQVA